MRCCAAALLREARGERREAAHLVLLLHLAQVARVGRARGRLEALDRLAPARRLGDVRGEGVRLVLVHTRQLRVTRPLLRHVVHPPLQPLVLRHLVDDDVPRGRQVALPLLLGRVARSAARVPQLGMPAVEVARPTVHALGQPPPLAAGLALHTVRARPAGAVAPRPLLVDLVRGGREPVLDRREHLVRMRGRVRARLGLGWGQDWGQGWD